MTSSAREVCVGIMYVVVGAWEAAFAWLSSGHLARRSALSDKVQGSETDTEMPIASGSCSPPG